MYRDSHVSTWFQYFRFTLLQKVQFDMDRPDSFQLQRREITPRHLQKALTSAKSVT